MVIIIFLLLKKKKIKLKILDLNINIIFFFKNKKIRQIKQIRNQTLYHQQLFERICKPYKWIIRKNLYYLIEDLNNSMNLKILQFMVEDPSFQPSEDDLYVLLEELT